MMASKAASSADAKILGRLFKPDHGTISPEGARGILEIQFSDADLKRMHELALKNQGGKLTPREEAELDSYSRIGLILDLMKSKARLTLKKRRLTG
jgi:hypothetical protein